MTREELSRLYWLNRRIAFDRERLEELQAAAEAITPKISGLPHAPVDPHNSENIKIAVAEQRELVELQVRQSVIEYKRLTRWLSEVKDPLVYQILYSRYVEGLSWNDVAGKVGGMNTEDSVRKQAMRYIEKSCDLNLSDMSAGGVV